MVEVLAVGVAVDHRPAQPELVHRALELVGCGAGVLHRQMGEAAVTVGAFDDLASKEIVRGAHPADCGRSIGFRLHAWSGEREDATLDAGRIHRFEPHLAEVGETRVEFLPSLGWKIDDGRRPVFLETGREKVFLDGNLADHGAPPSCSSPLFSVPCGWRNRIKWTSRQASWRASEAANGRGKWKGKVIRTTECHIRAKS